MSVKHPPWAVRLELRLPRSAAAQLQVLRILTSPAQLLQTLLQPASKFLPNQPVSGHLRKVLQRALIDIYSPLAGICG
jgi:hypothetical protein